MWTGGRAIDAALLRGTKPVYLFGVTEPFVTIGLFIILKINPIKYL